MDGPVRRAAALPSEARELSLLSPVLDFRLREYQVENQAHHVNGRHEEEYFEPGGFRVLGDESAERLRAVGTAAGLRPQHPTSAWAWRGRPSTCAEHTGRP